jgi:hypothetical protein
MDDVNRSGLQQPEKKKVSDKFFRQGIEKSFLKPAVNAVQNSHKPPPLGKRKKITPGNL